MNEKELHQHPEPEPNPDFCSCCRKGITHGFDNVMVKNGGAFGAKTLDGREGVVGVNRPLAYYHARCANEHYPCVIECKYCSCFALEKMVPVNQEIDETDENGKRKTVQKTVPITDLCKCCCHTNGAKYCSLLIL